MGFEASFITRWLQVNHPDVSARVAMDPARPGGLIVHDESGKRAPLYIATVIRKLLVDPDHHARQLADKLEEWVQPAAERNAWRLHVDYV